MGDKRKPELVSKIEGILSILWASYEHIYDARETSTNNGINFLMIVSTFLAIFCLSLYDKFNSPFFLFPIPFQMVALLILLKRFFIKGYIPWLKYQDILKELDDNSFTIKILAELKACENETYKRLEMLRQLIKISLFLLVFSIFLTALGALFFIFRGSSWLYVATALLIFCFLALCFFYKKIPSFQIDSEINRIESDIKELIQTHRKHES